jgi:hypothetical protein
VRQLVVVEIAVLVLLAEAIVLVGVAAVDWMIATH